MADRCGHLGVRDLQAHNLVSQYMMRHHTSIGRAQKACWQSSGTQNVSAPSTLCRRLLPLPLFLLSIRISRLPLWLLLLPLLLRDSLCFAFSPASSLLAC